jgi:hypothetical protein
MHVIERQSQFQARFLKKQSAKQNAESGCDALSINSIDEYATNLSLTKVLSEIYEVTHQVIGEAKFHELANEFITHHLAIGTAIQWFGAHFPKFLAGIHNGFTSNWLIELAELEWALHYSLAAQNTRAWTLEELQCKTPQECQDMALYVHLSVTLLTCKWNSPQLWETMRSTANITEIQPTRMAQKILVWRDLNLSSQWRVITTIEYELIKAVARNHNLFDSFKLVKRKSKIKMHDWNQWAVDCLESWSKAGLMVKNDSVN